MENQAAYEIVVLEEKAVVGISTSTNNASPDMGEKIGGLWNRFYEEGFYNSTEGKKTGKVLGIYTDYVSDETGDYTFITACETDGRAEIPANAIKRIIPAGKYAKFIAKGELHEAVAKCWQQIWKSHINRAFLCDFEEYQTSSMENAEIHIYIGLKEE